MIHGKDYGVHPFMTQLRSLDDFRPLPGIELGDIGPTMGLNGTDNGYAIFNHIRIPRENMLMRYSRVLRDGTYIESPNNKLLYGTMMYIRNGIVNVAAFQLAQVATIAIRYSVVREQGNLSFNPSDMHETPIISFKSQQYRLLTIMSRAFAILFASKASEKLYQDLISRQAQDDHGLLAHAHSTFAGRESICRADRCRRSGGCQKMLRRARLLVTVRPTGHCRGSDIPGDARR
jgi:acyl-CoA oxidase